MRYTFKRAHECIDPRHVWFSPRTSMDLLFFSVIQFFSWEQRHFRLFGPVYMHTLFCLTDAVSAYKKFFMRQLDYALAPYFVPSMQFQTVMSCFGEGFSTCASAPYSVSLMQFQTTRICFGESVDSCFLELIHLHCEFINFWVIILKLNCFWTLLCHRCSTLCGSITAHLQHHAHIAYLLLWTFSVRCWFESGIWQVSQFLWEWGDLLRKYSPFRWIPGMSFQWSSSWPQINMANNAFYEIWPLYGFLHQIWLTLANTVWFLSNQCISITSPCLVARQVLLI